MKNNTIVQINMSALHHAEFGQLMVRFYDDFGKSGINAATDADFKIMFDALQLQIPPFNSALDQVQASEESKEIARLDEVRDAALQNLRNALKAFRNSTEDAEIKAYRAISLLIFEYKDVENESMEEETNKLNNLSDRLESTEYSTEVADLGIERFVTRLKTANTDFNTLFAQRSYHTSQKEIFDVKLLRKNMTADYNKMIHYVAAMAAVKIAPYHKNILAVINNGRTYFADTVLSRRKPTKPPVNPPS